MASGTEDPAAISVKLITESGTFHVCPTHTHHMLIILHTAMFVAVTTASAFTLQQLFHITPSHFT